MSNSRRSAPPRECPICGAGAKRLAFPYGTVFNGTEFFYFKCAVCGSTFVSPVPSQADFEKMYSVENYHDCHYREIRTDGHYSDSIQFLKQNCAGRRSVVDFGCGNGSFLAVAKDNNFECAGIEFHPSAIANVRNKTGLPVTTLEEARASGRRFEIIHLGDVLEHLPDPTDTIKTLASLLSPEGVFYIEGPLENQSSAVYLSARSIKALRRTLGHRIPGATAPTHLFRVNARNQKQFFTNRLGYRCLAFHVYETGWPYLSPAHSRSVSTMFKSTIGWAAIALSTVVRFGPYRVFGNRFRSVFQPLKSGAGS
jgi:2-polyprenyl-3-methyl-5-hydroxy-6-metoxy-1,4-benzoquinol methylase